MRVCVSSHVPGQSPPRFDLLEERQAYRFWLDRSTVRPLSRIVLACLKVAHEMRDNMQGLILTFTHPNNTPESWFLLSILRPMVVHCLYTNDVFQGI
jgi:hypothetical protein